MRTENLNMENNARILQQLRSFRLLTDEDDEIAGMPIEAFYRNRRPPIIAPDEEPAVE